MAYLVQGLLQGSTYALIAMGLVLTYSVVKAFQFAHGVIVMFAAYAFYFAYEVYGQHALVAFAITLILTTALSIAVSYIVFEPLLGRHFPSLIAALGVATIIHQLIAIYAFHGEAVAYPQSLRIAGELRIGGFSVEYNKLAIFAASIVSIILLDTFFRNTRPGMEMRAVCDDPNGAQISGVNLTRTIRYAFAIAGVAAAIVGVLIGCLLSNINPEIGDALAIKGMAAALLGGATSMRGAILAGFIIGAAESLAVGYLSSTFSPAIAYLCILFVLLVRPGGLLGKSESARA